MTFSWLNTHDNHSPYEIPTLWLVGKPDSGKRSIVDALTSYDAKPSIKGFVQCGNKTKSFDFPSDVSPVMRFFVTSGEDNFPSSLIEDASICLKNSHLIIVSARIMDADQAHIYEKADFLRHINPRRPVLLALTCLHEAYDGCNHPDPYPFTGPPPWSVHDHKLQQLNHAGLKHWSLMKHPASRTVLIDITSDKSHFNPSIYGVDALLENIIDLLPDNARRLLVGWMNSDEIIVNYVIYRYSCLANIAGSIPFPGDQSPEVVTVQESMINTLSRLLKSPVNNAEFLELSRMIMESNAISWQVPRLTAFIAKILPILSQKNYPSFHYVTTAAMGLLYIWFNKKIISGHHPSFEKMRLEYRNKIRAVLNKWPLDYYSLPA